MSGDGIVIPNKLQPEILTRIHTGHNGIEKCKRRARQSVFWPGMTKGIELIVKQC